MEKSIDFIIAGPPRAGTTYVFKNLASHPQIAMASSAGEHSTGDIHFFDVKRQEGRENYAKGLGWYLNHFNNDAGQCLRGEKTADYFADGQAPLLINTLFRKVKIIIVLRDPVERAYSHYWHERPNLGGRDFDSIVQHGKDIGDARIISSGYYGTHIDRYFSIFGADRVHTIIFDDIKTHPEAVLDALCNFLGIDNTSEFPFKYSQVNRGGKSTGIDLIRKASRQMREATPGLHRLLTNSLAGAWARRLLAKKRQTMPVSNPDRARKNSYAYPPMSESARAILQGLYQSEVSRASSILGRDLEILWWSGTRSRNLQKSEHPE